MRWVFAILCGALALSIGVRAQAQNCALPFLLQNNTIADATQVMANFNSLNTCINANAVPANNIIVNPSFHWDGPNFGAVYTFTTNNSRQPMMEGWDMRIISATVPSVTAQRLSAAPFPGFAEYVAIVVPTGSATVAAGDLLTLVQPIDLGQFVNGGFGFSTAKQWSLGMWVNSTVAGFYSLFLHNQGGTRTYVGAPCNVAANTNTLCTIQGALGDITGTWPNNGAASSTAAIVGLTLMCGTNFQTTANSWQNGDLRCTSSQTQFSAISGATVKVTGVQMSFTPVLPQFIARDVASDLLLAERWYETSYNIGTIPGTVTGTGAITAILGAAVNSGSNFNISPSYKSVKNCNPTMTLYSPSAGTSGKVDINGSANTASFNSASAFSTQVLPPIQNGSGGAWTDGSIISFHFTADCRQ